MLKKVSAIVAVTAGFLFSGAAIAAVPAFTTSDLNIRTGPGSSYQRFDTIPEGGRVTVYGCLSGYNWCDVGWAGERGWVSGNYLAYAGPQYSRRPIPNIGFSVGLPVIGFSPDVYHRRYYADRPWYRDRYLDRRDAFRGRYPERREVWRDRYRSPDRREVWRDRYPDRREAWRDRREFRDGRPGFREQRRDLGDAQRDLRRERGATSEMRGGPRDVRQERRELREARQDQRRERRD